MILHRVSFLTVKVTKVVRSDGMIAGHCGEDDLDHWENFYEKTAD